MIRGLPDDYLFPGNNKIWHGTVAWHFCFFRMVRMCGLNHWNTVKVSMSSSRNAQGRNRGTDSCPLHHLTRAGKEKGILHLLK